VEAAEAAARAAKLTYDELVATMTEELNRFQVGGGRGVIAAAAQCAPPLLPACLLSALFRLYSPPVAVVRELQDYTCVLPPIAHWCAEAAGG
jgi:hypothetical protein